MRSRVSRHLDAALGEGAPGVHGAFAPRALLVSALRAEPGAELPGPAAPLAAAEGPPPEFNWRDYTAMLLHVAAEIEHSLMVQYLVAAYSLGGPQVPAPLRDEVRDWQETILGIAKEEMGHLVTVQNLLTALGMPLNLDREDYPWGGRFYPFQFSLQPLSLDSLATYVCAESPADWTGPEAKEIKARAASAAHGDVNRVGTLYASIIAILSDIDRIADADFDASTLPRQASWDEWGRGYRKGQRQETPIPGVDAPDLLILPVYSRDTAVAALNEIGEQGESPAAETDPDDTGEDSHFVRFLTIYRALSKLSDDQQRLVSRPMLSNPSTAEITNPTALGWAHLLNLRYRILLVNLSHAFELASTATGGAVTARGGLVNRTFAEMYNLRSIAATLVELPAFKNDPDGPRAAPPFQMPYTLELPRSERDRWRLHRDLVEAAAALIATLPRDAPPGATDYLTALEQADALVLEQIERML
jgi:Ferritin-like